MNDLPLFTPTPAEYLQFSKGIIQMELPSWNLATIFYTEGKKNGCYRIFFLRN